MNQKSKTTAILLALFLGCWGVHLFYLGEKKKGIIYLIIGLFGLFFFLPLLITGILALVDLIKYAMMSDAEFAAKYNGRCGQQNHINQSYPFYNQPVNHQSTYVESSSPNDFTFCTTCGEKIAKGVKFCPSCGNAQNS